MKLGRMLGCFVALFARLWFLQVMAAPTLNVEAQANRIREVAVEAPYPADSVAA